MESYSDIIWDVVVIGAGPAGSVCAYHLARTGHAVLLIDKQDFPRDKACGDFLIGDALQILDNLGFRDEVDNIAQHSRLLSVHYENDLRIELTGTFTTLSRRVFDSFLWRKATEAGARFRNVRAIRVSRDHPDQRAIVSCKTGEAVQARYAVVATGADSLLTRHALNSHGPGANAFAFRRYVVSTTEITDAIIIYHPSIQPGYAWVIPVEHNGDGFRYNVGAGWPLEGVNKPRHIDEVMKTALAGVPEAGAVMAKLIREESWHGAPLKCGLTLDRCILSDRCVAIGEAVGTTYPFTGEGIGKAMLSGQYAAESLNLALANDDPSLLAGYPERLREMLPRYEAFAQIESLLARPSTSKFLLNRLRKSPYLTRMAHDVFHYDISPAPLLKPVNILKSFVK